MDGFVFLQIAIGYFLYVLLRFGSVVYQEVKRCNRMREHYKTHHRLVATYELTEEERELAKVEKEYAEFKKEVL